jgi:hypothetical protein
MIRANPFFTHNLAFEAFPVRPHGRRRRPTLEIQHNNRPQRRNMGETQEKLHIFTGK